MLHRLPAAVAAIACLGIAVDLLAAQYSATDLGLLDGTSTYGLGVNNSGQAVGYSFDIRLDISGGTTGDYRVGPYAFVYDSTLHTIAGTGLGGYGRGINNAGQIVGDDYTGAYIYNGSVHYIGSAGSYGYAINNLGQATGSMSVSDTESHAYLYDGTIHDLGTLGGPLSEGHAINDHGQIVGISTPSTNGLIHAFLYDGTMHDLGTLGGAESFAYGINNSGVVVGQAHNASDGLDAFLYDGTMHDLGPGSAEAINNSGQVVGSSYFGPADNPIQSAFLYTASGGMVDLDTLIDPSSGIDLFDASGISDSGDITGYGYVGIERHAFLLTPVPEPPSFFICAESGLFCAWCVNAFRITERRMPKTEN